MPLSAARFFRIQLLVRFRKQLFDSFSVAAIYGDTDACGELRLFRIARQYFVNTAGDKVCFSLASLRQDQRKLIATIPRGGVDRTTVYAQNIRQPAQRAAAHQMTMCVVDFLQSVEI